MRSHGAQRTLAGPRIGCGLVQQRVHNAVGRRVSVADARKRGGHLGDDAVAQGVSIRVRCGLDQVGYGVVGDRLGFGSDCVCQGLLPDLIADLVAGRALQVDLEDHRDASPWVSLRVPVSGETAIGTSSSSPACCR